MPAPAPILSLILVFSILTPEQPMTAMAVDGGGWGSQGLVIPVRNEVYNPPTEEEEEEERNKAEERQTAIDMEEEEDEGQEGLDNDPEADDETLSAEQERQVRAEETDQDAVTEDGQETLTEEKKETEAEKHHDTTTGRDAKPDGVEQEPPSSSSSSPSPSLGSPPADLDPRSPSERVTPSTGQPERRRSERAIQPLPASASSSTPPPLSPGVVAEVPLAVSAANASSQAHEETEPPCNDDDHDVTATGGTATNMTSTAINAPVFKPKSLVKASDSGSSLPTPFASYAILLSFLSLFLSVFISHVQ